MADSSNNSAVLPQTVVARDRGMQRAAGVLLGIVVVLIGFRWYADRSSPRPSEMKRESLQVELNHASRSELMQLPGVGPSRADKILAYRSSNGGFQRVEDLRAVDGIGEVTLQRLKPHIQVEGNADPSDEPLRLSKKPSVASRSSGNKKPVPDGAINLNRASVAELQQLPGIGPALAQRIVDERGRKPFAAVEELRRVSGIGAKRLEQIRPYAIVTE